MVNGLALDWTEMGNWIIRAWNRNWNSRWCTGTALLLLLLYAFLKRDCRNDFIGMALKHRMHALLHIFIDSILLPLLLLLLHLHTTFELE